MFVTWKRSGRPRWTVCVLGVAAFLAPPAMGESVVIKRKYDPAKPFYTEQKLEATQRIESPSMPGGAMDVKFSQGFGYREKVKESSDGKRIVTLTFERLSQTIDMPMMGSLEYDTDDPEHPDAAPHLSAIHDTILGESLTIEVDKDGKVLSFSGLDAISEKVSKKATMNQFWMMLKDHYTDERGIDNWAKDPLHIYPNKSVKVGDEWNAESTLDIPQIGKTLNKYRYKLDKIATEDGRKVAHISYTTQTTLAPDAAAKGEEGAAPKPKVEGSGSGNAVYDIERGLIVRNVGDEKQKIVARNAAMGGAEMTVHVKMKSTVRVLSDEDRNRQKEQMARRIEERKKAEEEDDDDDDDDDDYDDDDD